MWTAPGPASAAERAGHSRRQPLLLPEVERATGVARRAQNPPGRARRQGVRDRGPRGCPGPSPGASASPFPGPAHALQAAVDELAQLTHPVLEEMVAPHPAKAVQGDAAPLGVVVQVVLD